MATTLAYRFRVRRRTTANWISTNEVLLDSEIGLESDLLKRSKMGPGNWNDLPWYTAGAIDATSLAGISDGDVMVWNAAAGSWIAGAPAGGGGGSNPWTLVRKTADEARISTTVVAGDAQLTTALLAGTRYRVKIFLAMNAAGASGFKITINYTGTTTIVEGRRSQALASGSTTTALETALFSNLYSTAGSGTSYLEWDYIITTGTAGTLSIQWAQNSSSGSALTLRAGSFIEHFVS